MSYYQLNCQEKDQKTNGLACDCAKECTRNGGNTKGNSQFFINHQQPFHMGIWFQPPEMEGQSQEHSLGQGSSSGTTVSGIVSPVPAFYATERPMGFPQYSYQSGNPNFSSQMPRSSEVSFGSETLEFQTKSTRESGLKSQFRSNHKHDSNERFGEIPRNNFPERELISQLKRELLDDIDTSNPCQASFPFEANQDPRVSLFNKSSLNPLSPLFFVLFCFFFFLFSSRKRGFFSPWLVSYIQVHDHNLYISQLEHVRNSAGISGRVSVNAGNSVSSGASAFLGKTRIRWTQDLHNQFVECVNHLGGAESK